MPKRQEPKERSSTSQEWESQRQALLQLAQEQLSAYYASHPKEWSDLCAQFAGTE